MTFAIVGAGAIGGFLGARLALAGEKVTFVARGANLEAIRRNGFTLIEEDGTGRRADCTATAITDAGPHDFVLLALKAHQVTSIASELPRLFHAGTALVTLQNGLPWWYFHKLGGPFEGRPVRTADPDGQVAANIGADRVIGTVVYPASELVAPGVVKVVEGNRFTLGEPDGSKSERVLRLSEALTKAGFKAPVSSDIRAEIWLKLWGNATFNPISALTHATLVDICQFPETRALAFAVMAEAQTVAEKLGVRSRISIEKRIAGAESVGAHKTSMLQDVEAGRALELEALTGSVIELARLTETQTPHLDALYACARLLAKTLAEAKGRLRIEPA
ncbi:MAG: 2-dehydropantoate 2-reductase [Rhodomicrobium sp.]